MHSGEYDSRVDHHEQSVGARPRAAWTSPPRDGECKWRTNPGAWSATRRISSPGQTGTRSRTWRYSGGGRRDDRDDSSSTL